MSMMKINTHQYHNRSFSVESMSNEDDNEIPPLFTDAELVSLAVIGAAVAAANFRTAFQIGSAFPLSKTIFRLNFAGAHIVGASGAATVAAVAAVKYFPGQVSCGMFYWVMYLTELCCQLITAEIAAIRYPYGSNGVFL